MPLFIKYTVEIFAHPETVWKVLTTVEYIKQWEDRPADYGDATNLTIGRTIIWKHPESNSEIKGTILSTYHHGELEVALSDSSWKYQPHKGDFTYKYTLEDKYTSTIVHFSMGDYEKIPHGEELYREALESENTEIHRIKALAETMTGR